MTSVIHMFKNEYVTLCGKSPMSHGKCLNHLCVRKDPTVVTCKRCLSIMAGGKPIKPMPVATTAGDEIHAKCKHCDSTAWTIKSFGAPYCNKKDHTLKSCGKCKEHLK